MITQVEITTPRVATSPLPFDDAGSAATDKIQIRDISGLGPINATVNSTQFGSVDSEFFTGATVGKRNIVMRLGLHPDWADYTYEKLRNMLYLYFMPKNKITIKIVSTHMETVTIDGIVESCDPNIFSKDPEFQISIICVDGAFTALEATVIPGYVIAFETGTLSEINYQGNIDTGFVFEVHSRLDVPIAIGEHRIQNNSDLMILDDVTVDMTQFLRGSTIKGDKFIQYVPVGGGDPINIIGKLLPGSVWTMLKGGLNLFAIRTDSIVVGQPWTVTYYAKYGGI